MDWKDDPGRERSGVSPEQRAWLEKRLRQKWNSAGAAQEILPLTNRSTAPLSSVQERIWFLQQLQPGDPTFNRPAALKLTGPLNLAALQQTLNAILERHEVLRTTFPSQDGKPVQIPLADAVWPLSIIDLGGLPPFQRNAEAKKLATAAALKIFDLARGPLVRACLYRLEQEEHLLLLVIHHIAFDAWSVKVLVKEISSLYEALAAGKPAPLPGLPIQYADFAYWQRRQVQQQMEDHLSYWKEQLSGLAILDLPTDHPRPTVQTCRGGTESFVLPPDLTALLKELSRRENATLFMTLLAAFQTLLSRYSGKADIAVGSLNSGRNRLETEGLIGCFINTFVLRTGLAGEPGFRQLLARVRQVCLEAYTHDLPFEKLVEALQPERDLSRTPFFQVLFNLEDFPGKTFTTGSLNLEEVDFEWNIAPFDLTLEIINKNQTLHGCFFYNADLFETATVRRLAGHFRNLLEGIVAHPERSIALLPLLSDSEQHRLLVEWNATKTAYPKDRGIHQLFEAQAERHPDALAVRYGGDTLTYAQLDARANQTAHYLKKLGVGPEVPVGLCLEPSVELIVGLLGILKAGGCYVPLDPGYPKERLAFMLADTGAQAVLFQAKFKELLQVDKTRTICLDADQALISRESAARAGNDTSPENPACILYTSGSTGQPKGVPIPQVGVNRLVLNTNYLHFQSSDRVAQIANISFDAATFEIWGALLNGGCLVIAPRDILLSPDDLAAFIREQKITVMLVTSALFNQVARENPDAFRSVRDLFLGGETLDPRWVREVMQKGAPARLINAYGPTENTTIATWYQVPEPPAGNRAIPIGRPIANTTVYILDPHLQPVPIGVTGELCLGGDGLARGYLHRPELTADKFIPHPFSDEPGARLYRTGDLGRYLPDGNIDFLGRLDDQIKIRGFRVEPREIEAALLSHPGVKEALVMLREMAPGDKRLIAYIVAAPEPSLTAESLRDFLRDRLPVYMLPAFYVFLDKFPLDPHGKVDRQKLFALEVKPGISEKVYVPPRDAVEQRLVAAWEAVLEVSPIGVQDDFFALGGHSLLAVQLFAKIEKTLGKKLPLTLLYQRPTVAQLAEVIRAQDRLTPESCPILVPINISGSTPPFFLLQGKDALPFIERSLGEDQPLYYLQSPLETDENPFIGCDIEGVAAGYLQEMRRVQPGGPYFFGGFSLGGLLAFEIARQLHEQGSKVGLLFLVSPASPGGPGERAGFIPEKSLPLACRSAIKNYHPGICPAPSVLIQDRSALQGDRFDWRRMLTGCLGVHLIDALHEELLRRPHVQEWVQYLQKYLAEAQAMAAGNN